jgi:hypothetical protein
MHTHANLTVYKNTLYTHAGAPEGSNAANITTTDTVLDANEVGLDEGSSIAEGRFVAPCFRDGPPPVDKSNHTMTVDLSPGPSPGMPPSTPLGELFSPPPDLPLGPPPGPPLGPHPGCPPMTSAAWDPSAELVVQAVAERPRSKKEGKKGRNQCRMAQVLSENERLGSGLRHKMIAEKTNEDSMQVEETAAVAITPEWLISGSTNQKLKSSGSCRNGGAAFAARSYLGCRAGGT